MELNELISKLNAVEQAIANYEELDSDMDSPEYVARGNGFCDSKYSEDFIESQIAKLHCKKESIEREISLLKKRN